MKTKIGEPATAQMERHFSDAMIESMPGILYLYDEAGRFLRWNQNMLKVTGYSAEEFSVLHPLDLFGVNEKLLITSKIAEVFERGEASVEAALVAKDGSAVPYFFTGRRVWFENKACLVGVGIDVSERKAAEAALSKSEQRYRSTLDNILEGCQLIGFDWTYLYLNRAASNHNRRPNEELLGRKMPDMWPGIEATGLFALLKCCLEERIPFHEETEFRFLDGSKGWFDVRAQPVPEGIFVLSIDITERREAEEALKDSERKLRALFEQAPLGIAVIDSTTGQFLKINPQYCRITGYSESELLKLTFQSITHPDDVEEDVDHMRRLVEGSLRTFHLEKRYLCKNGSKVWVNLTCVPLWVADSGKQHIAIAEDITERRQSEVAIRELNANLERRVAERTEELAEARDRAEAADRLKSAFLATMSHELRTPLNSIIGFTGIVLQGLAGPLNPEQTKQLSMVRGSARHLLELINDVLDISKIEAGQLAVQAEPMNLADSIERVISSVRPLGEKKGLKIDVAMPATSILVLSDRRRVEQILLNLLSNAIKFTERGSVKLGVQFIEGHLMELMGKPRDALRITVTDTGMGIKPGNLAILFQPFRQIDTGLTRQHEGTGLGLAICRRLAELLGGKIFAESEWGRGSVFTLILPVTKDA